MEEALAHADALYNFALHLGRDRALAEDLVQETYARALAAATRFEAGSVKSWLFRILKNTFIDLYRRERRSPTDDGVEADRAVEPRQESEVMGRQLVEALSQLGDEARMAVLLDLEGFSEAEIAETMGIAPGTVKSRLFRARAALRERIGDGKR
jgi:RNA polymerase sigma-70 factor (ECF subfamily)